MGDVRREVQLLRRRLCLTAAALAVAACAPAVGPRHPDARPAAVIAERFLTPPQRGAGLDSVAVWSGARPRLLVATAKTGNALVVFDADTGAVLRRFGASGRGAGELERPNGIVILDDYAFVVERDNRRVQVFHLPGGANVGTFGTDTLRRPYGIGGFEKAGDYVLYVTDNYQSAVGGYPPDGELDRRVHRFRVRARGNALAAAHERTFGSTSGRGTLRKVETIVADPRHDRVLIAEEDPRERSVKIYDLDGVYTGTTLADWFRVEPEGIALVPCGDAGGHWVMTDQSPRTADNVFHVFDRARLVYQGSFRGRITDTTDGVAAGGGFFYALHHDEQIAAFAWSDVVSALRLEPCAAGA